MNQLKTHTSAIVTYCDNAYYWHNKLTEVAKAVDFISVHTYPVWIGKDVEEGKIVAKNDYNAVRDRYPNKQCIITETGWPTTSNGHAFPKENATQMKQLDFIRDMEQWSEENEIIIFFFEAFDEFWKGSDDPSETEKHWGYYLDDRSPKLVKNIKNRHIFFHFILWN